MNVRLRPLEEQDAYTSIKWRNQADIWTYTLAANRAGPAIEDELTWIREVTADDSGRRFAIVADDVYVGNIYLTGIDAGTAEYHIFIGEKSYWGKGIARKATQQVLSFAKDMLRLKNIYLVVHPDNLIAVKLYDSLGFVRQGMDENFIRMDLCLDNYLRSNRVAH